MKLSSQPEELVFFRRWDRNPTADLLHAVVAGDGKALARTLQEAGKILTRESPDIVG